MGDAYLYDGKNIEVGGQKIKVPKFSEWEEVCSCGDCHVAYFPEIRKYFCNDLEIDIPTTIMSISVVLLIFAFELWSICISTDGVTQLSLLIVGSILHVFWLFSHLEAMFTSPGYLPWFWSIEQRKAYTYKEKFSGIVTNKEQYNFAIQGVCPERAIVSASGRRIFPYDSDCRTQFEHGGDGADFVVCHQLYDGLFVATGLHSQASCGSTGRFRAVLQSFEIQGGGICQRE